MSRGCAEGVIESASPVTFIDLPAGSGCPGNQIRTHFVKPEMGKPARAPPGVTVPLFVVSKNVRAVADAKQTTMAAKNKT
jgi:hypothetical protein